MNSKVFGSSPTWEETFSSYKNFASNGVHLSVQRNTVACIQLTFQMLTLQTMVCADTGRVSTVKTERTAAIFLTVPCVRAQLVQYTFYFVIICIIHPKLQTMIYRTIYPAVWTSHAACKTHINPDSKVHGANMRPTWVLSAPDEPHDGPMNLAIREAYRWSQRRTKVTKRSDYLPLPWGPGILLTDAQLVPCGKALYWCLVLVL